MTWIAFQSPKLHSLNLHSPKNIYRTAIRQTSPFAEQLFAERRHSPNSYSSNVTICRTAICRTSPFTKQLFVEPRYSPNSYSPNVTYRSWRCACYQLLANEIRGWAKNCYQSNSSKISTVYLNITYISDIFVAPVDKTENRKNGDLKKN